jgi:hypothetical protein
MEPASSFSFFSFFFFGGGGGGGGGPGGVLGPGPWLYQLHASFDSVACGNVLPVHYLCGFFTYFYCTISLLWDLEFRGCLKTGKG